VKLVKLADKSRQQQVNTGFFDRIEAVPQYALTLTLPTICQARRISCLAMGERKAGIVKTMLTGEIAPACPASILRKYPTATLYLDEAAASAIDRGKSWRFGTELLLPPSNRITDREQLGDRSDRAARSKIYTSWVEVTVMKAMLQGRCFANGSISICVILLLSYSVPSIATEVNGNVSLAQSSVTVNTNSDGEGVQSTTVSIDRADLNQPHILRVQGLANNSPIEMRQVTVKINGRSIRSISNNSLELNLAPMMKAGSYEIEISATSPRPEDTILVNFKGKNTNVTQQFSGSGTIKQKLVINVR
jgi:Glucosamine-6-phosphate isomerases/6-phosphogluconolactonase